MRFRESVLKTISERIAQLGLKKCPVCDGELLAVDSRPVLLQFGGLKSTKESPTGDPDANVWFMIRVGCEACGYAMLFDSEKFHGPNEPILVRGDEEG